MRLVASTFEELPRRCSVEGTARELTLGRVIEHDLVGVQEVSLRAIVLVLLLFCLSGVHQNVLLILLPSKDLFLVSGVCHGVL